MLILAYAMIFVILEKDDIRTLHEEVPTLQYIWVSLWIFDNTYLLDDTYQLKKQLQWNLQEFFEWKENQWEDVWGNIFLTLDEDVSYKRLYSPSYTFSWKTNLSIAKISITLSHEWRELVKTRSTKRTADWSWEYKVSLPNEMMFDWENVYLIEAQDISWKVVSKKVTINVDFKRIEIGDSTIYVDPQFIPDWFDEDILLSTLDMKQQEVSFITYWCDESDPKAPILLENSFQFREIPACMTFSLVEDYLLRFESVWKQWDEYLYSVHSPDDWLIVDTFPLYHQHLWSAYYTLLFREKEFNRFATLYAHGNEEQYVLRIERINLWTKQKELEIVVTDWNQLVAQNDRQKIHMYLYKERDRKKSLWFPWNRYKYRLKSWNWEWNLLNEWALYWLPLSVYAPRKEFWSTFTFRVTLDGDILYIDDSIKVTQLDINAMWTSLKVEDRPVNMDDPAQCRSLNTAIHRNLIWDAPLKWSSFDYPVIVGEWRHYSSVKIFHNWKSTWSYADQLYKWYAYYRLGKERWNLVPWENTYTIKSYDQRWNQICDETIRLNVE